MKVFIFSLWVIAVGVATWVMAPPNDRDAAQPNPTPCQPLADSAQERWVTTQMLRINHRVNTTDVKPTGSGPSETSAVLGRYMKCTASKGTAIGESHLRRAPEFRTGGGRVPYLVPLGGQLVLGQLLNAGSVVDVWNDGRPVLREALVLALVCQDEKDPCVLVADVASDEAQKLATLDPKKFLVIVRALTQE